MGSTPVQRLAPAPPRSRVAATVRKPAGDAARPPAARSELSAETTMLQTTTTTSTTPAPTVSCASKTTPCACATLAAAGCGWSASSNVCKLGRTTNCIQCPTMPVCQPVPWPVLKQLPKALHYDIEPHSVPQWGTDRAGSIAGYLQILQKISAATKGKVPFHLDMPGWYDSIDVTGLDGHPAKLSEVVQGITDGVYLMAYRDSSAGIISLAETEIAWASAHGKKVYVLVETMCATGEDPMISFCEEGAQLLETALAEVNAKFAGQPGFGGVAVHDWANYAALAPANFVAPATGVSRALFQWDGNVCYDPVLENAMFAFTDSHRVERILFGCNNLVVNDQPSLTKFLNDLPAHNLNYELVFGKFNAGLPENHAETMLWTETAVESYAAIHDVSTPIVLPSTDTSFLKISSVFRKSAAQIDITLTGGDKTTTQVTVKATASAGQTVVGDYSRVFQGPLNIVKAGVSRTTSLYTIGVPTTYTATTLTIAWHIEFVYRMNVYHLDYTEQVPVAA